MKYNITKFKTNLPFQYITTLVGSVMMIIAGSLQGWATPSLPQLLDPNSSIRITSSEGSWLAVMPFLGSPIGALTAANVVNRIGRKRCLLLISPLYCVAWMMIAFANDIYLFLGSRIISGIADGICYSVYPMYIGEVAHSRVRGFLSSSIGLTLSIGYLYISIIGARFSIPDTAYISVVFPLSHFILLLLMPESPYYLIMKNQKEEAMKSLIKLRGYQHVEEELEKFSDCVEEDLKQKGTLCDLFKVKSNRRACCVIMVLQFLQQFSGQQAIVFYITIIFNESGTVLSPSTCTSIYLGIQVICSLVCSVLMDRLGRRPLLIISTAGSSLSLGLQAAYFYLKEMTLVDLENYTCVPLVALLTYDVFFSLGMSTIPTALLGELFPTSVKAKALSLANIYFGLMVFTSTKFLQIVTDLTGMFIPFSVFAGISVCSLIYVIFFLLETKNKTLEEIQDDFKRSRKNKTSNNTHM